MITQRKLALDILHRTFKDKGFANLDMRGSLNVLPPEQRKLVSELVYGVLRNYDYLIYQAKDMLTTRTRLKNRMIIALALYERFYLKEKDYVVNSEYIKLAETKYDRNFLSAVLNNTLTLKDAPEHIKNSLPLWIYNLLKKQYTEEELVRILANYKRRPKVIYRLNHKRATFDDLKHLDIEVVNEDCFTCKKTLIGCKEYEDGLFYIQDINSSKLIKPLELKEDDIFLDACSAPGSKLFNAMDVLNEAYANDVSETRVELIRQKAEVLGFDNIHYSCADASSIKSDIMFDKILADVPCSGLGVISHRPDIKYNQSPENLDELVKIQAAIIDNLSGLLKKGGRMVYSTCTLNKKENGRQMDNFIKHHTDFRIIKDETIISDDGDCFYYCLLERV